MGSTKKQLSTETSGHALDKQTYLFKATLTGSFQGVLIPSVTSRWSCSKTDRSNCCSHETLFHEATCGFKRLDAVSYALNSGAGKTPSLRPQAVWFLLASSECCNFLLSRISRSCIRIFWTNFQFLSIRHDPLDQFCSCVTVF